MTVVTLTTDFGVESPYTAAMEGVLLSMNPRLNVVRITNSVPPQNIRAGSAILAETTPFFPEGTIHIAVIDPGVGTTRSILYAKIGEQHYVLPDNGLLSQLSEQEQPSLLFRLTNANFWRRVTSNTFHGRDIMAPIAAHLSLGVPPQEMGEPVTDFHTFDSIVPRVMADRICGEVVRIDSFGNLITNIHSEHLQGRPTDQRALIICGLYDTYGVMNTYGDGYEGSLVAIINSSNLLEIAVVGENASKRLNLQVGTPVTIGWEG